MAALSTAAENGDLEEVKKLIRNGAEIDKIDWFSGNVFLCFWWWVPFCCSAFVVACRLNWFVMFRQDSFDLCFEWWSSACGEAST